jgi:RNA polymerase sigma-70 factor, ECF subfamily
LRPDLSKFVGLDDGALVARAKAGDRKAFSELVRRHRSVVYRICYRILGNREDAEDATQEAFIRAYDKLDTFGGRSAFKTWMLRLAVNVGLNELDRAWRKRSLPLEPEATRRSSPSPSPEASPEADLLKSEAVDQLHKALRLLPPNHRAAVVLHDLEGLTYEEAADSLGVPEGTAKSWAHRGRRRLKELLT